MSQPSIRGTIRLAMMRRDCPVAPDAADDLLDIYRSEVPAEQVEAANVRLWLIEQTLSAVDASQDPAGIVPTLGPYLDGPLHSSHIAAYHAAQEA